MLCAGIGGWWSGRKRLGIEVLSKNRQEWINDLRKQVARFTSISAKMALNIVGSTEDKHLLDEMTELTIIRDYLLLLLNPQEEKSKKINESISNIMNHIVRIKNLNNDDNPNEITSYIKKIPVLLDELTKNTQDILKEEWKRVKEGK